LIDVVTAVADPERRRLLSLEAGQIIIADQSSRVLMVPCRHSGDFTAIKHVRPVVADYRNGSRQVGLDQPVADRRRLSTGQKHLRRAIPARQQGSGASEVSSAPGADGISLGGNLDRV